MKDVSSIALKRYDICVPAMDMMPTPFVASFLCMKRVGASRASFICNSLVYDARNKLAEDAIKTGADYVLWLDSDMQFAPDLMERLAGHMDNGIDYVSGLYFKRRFPVIPLIYDKVEIVDDDGKTKGVTQTYADYPRDSLFEIAGSGFGAVMTSTKLLKEVTDAYGAPFDPIPSVLGEDLAFCWRAKQLGYKLFCDSSIKVHHIGQFAYGEEHYQ